MARRDRTRDLYGVVDLEGDSLEIERPKLYVTGQTAPSLGITLIRGGIRVDADDVILQHIRVRPGDEIPAEIDCLNNAGGSNVIFDHCSASWGTDESASINSGREKPDITFSNNLIAESLNDSIRPRGAHSYGTLVMNRSKRVTIVGNLWANMVARHPRLKEGTSSVVANSVGDNFERVLNLGGGVDDETTVHEGTGTIIDSQEDVGGYPELEETMHTLDVPDEGVGEWLAQWREPSRIPPRTRPERTGTRTPLSPSPRCRYRTEDEETEFRFLAPRRRRSAIETAR